MINNRPDYRWVTIPDDMIINGEIMPLRQNKGSLRGEDVCFLMEALREIYSVVNNSNATMTMDKRILGERYRTVINGFRSFAQRASTSAGKPLKGDGWQKYYDLSDSSYYSPAYIDSTMIVDVSELKADATNFETGKPLNQQAVIDIFEDQMMLRHFQISQPQYNLIQNQIYVIEKTGSEDVHEEVSPPTVWNYATKISYSNGVETYSSEETTLGGGNFSYDPSYTLLKDQQFVKRAIVFVKFMLSVRRYNNSSLTRYTFNRTYPMNAVVQDGKYVLDSAQVVSAVKEFVVDQNLNLNPTDRTNGVRSGYMDMDAQWAVIELGDRMSWRQADGN